ncbi:hypothetical protein [Variovorax sp. dw_954]|uniref:hypothetical protein n=1 Tax=Variovorax sp. dw_954 TaxID=2720078 RepID=UPI001BD3D283|nr:hypothetical protein [Variovorax sp. dw_954]
MGTVPDIFTPRPIALARDHGDQFSADFLAYLPDNLHVYRAFIGEALKVARKGFQHYSARTIVEVLRHNSALQEADGPWKLNNNNTPYLARLFALDYPMHAGLFEFREAKAARRMEAANDPAMSRHVTPSHATSQRGHGRV